MSINKLGHGETPYTKEFKTVKVSMFNSGWQEIELPPCPKNDSNKTKTELKTLQKFILSNTDQSLQQIAQQDAKEPPFELKFLKIVKQHTPEKEEWLRELAVQMYKICLFFKEKYDRPRPWNMAKALKVDFPDIGEETETGDSPSYPSGHAFGSYFLAQVLSDMFPKYKNQLFNYAGEIVLNRMKAGIHFPSDIEAGKLLARKLYKYFKKPTKLEFKEWFSI